MRLWRGIPGGEVVAISYILLSSHSKKLTLPFRFRPLATPFVRPATLPSAEDQANDIVNPLPVLDLRKDRRTTFPVRASASQTPRERSKKMTIPHPPSIPLHNAQIRAHSFRQINLQRPSH